MSCCCWPVRISGSSIEQHRDFAVVAQLNQDRPIRREHARIVELSIVALVILAGTGLLSLLQASLLIVFGLVLGKIVTSKMRGGSSAPTCCC